MSSYFRRKNDPTETEKSSVNLKNLLMNLFCISHIFLMRLMLVSRLYISLQLIERTIKMLRHNL